jgi:hypothetical protein
MESEYMKTCFLRRCGQIEGCKDARLPLYDTDAEGNIVEMHVDGVRLVLDSIWEQISHEKCAQFCSWHCLTRFKCDVKQSYCYPIAVNGKRPNKLVAVMFAWYCVDVAEDAAYAARAAADAAAADAAAAYAADAAADAAAADAAAAYAARAAADAAAAYAAARAARAARDAFYLAASREIEKLVAAWGTPIKEGETKP